MTSARQIYLGSRRGPALPYDSEVEYLESTGTQWIDTGVFGESPSRFLIGYAFTESQDNAILLGAVNTSQLATKALYVAGQYPSNQNFVRVGNQYQSYGTVPLNAIEDVEVIISTDNCVVRRGGVQVVSLSVSASQNVGTDLYAFAINRNGVDNFHSKARINYLQIYIGGVLVRDFVSVRFTNELGQSEGAMYDRVSGQLFRNAGTGAFGFGTDIAGGGING